MKRIKAIACGLALLAGLLMSTAGLAQPAVDITEECTLRSPGRKMGTLHDFKYTSYWTSEEAVGPYLQIDTPEDEQAAYLYICFGIIPESWAIQEETADGWQTVIEGSRDYANVVVELSGMTHFRLVDTSGKRAQFKINELYVFTEGDLPDWVQRWEPTPQKADLLLLTAHPDDEVVFFGGTIPTYAVERGMDVAVVCMTYSNTTRLSELLNSLWHLGLRQYPIIGDFYDTYTNDLKEAYGRWDQEAVYAFVAEAIRRCKPEVILSHDVEGEYGHGAHMLCADAVQYCAPRTQDPAFEPESAAKWGTWAPKKLYLHLYGDQSVQMDWNVPLTKMGGKTGLELAQEAYQLHVTQQTTSFEVTDEGRYSCASFGLAYST